MLLFGVQVVAIAAGLFRADKHFNWVPYDQISHYRIVVTIAGRRLGAAEIADRYRRPAMGRENRNLHNLLAIIRYYETTYGRGQGARVQLTAIQNGHRTLTWSWPADQLLSPPAGGAAGH